MRENLAEVYQLVRFIQRKLSVLDDGDIHKVDTLKRIVAALDEVEDRRSEDDTAEIEVG